MKAYNCKSCGAQIYVNDNSHFTKCMYCGNSIAFIDSDLDKLNIRKMIPFTIRNEEVANKFKKIIKKDIESLNKIYVPVKYCDFDFDYYISYIDRRESNEDHSVSYYDENCFIDGRVNKYLLFGYGKINNVHYPIEIRNQKRVNFDPILLDDVSIEKNSFDNDMFSLKNRLEIISKKYGYQKSIVKRIYRKKSERCFVSNINIEDYTTLVPIYLIKTKDNLIYNFPGVKKTFSIEKKYSFKLLLCILVVIIDLIIIFLLKDIISFSYESLTLLLFMIIVPVVFISYIIKSVRKDALLGDQYDNYKINKMKRKSHSISKEKADKN